MHVGAAIEGRLHGSATLPDSTKMGKYDMAYDRVKNAASKRRMRSARKMLGLCTNCGQIPFKAGSGFVCEACRTDINTRKKTTDWRMKLEIIQTYGGRCACCGESHVRFLTIDHMNNDGKSDRKAISHGGATFYRWIKKQGYPTTFQILCWNCNLGKLYNNGVCPHKINSLGALSRSGTRCSTVCKTAAARLGGSNPPAPTRKLRHRKVTGPGSAPKDAPRSAVLPKFAGVVFNGSTRLFQS